LRGEMEKSALMDEAGFARKVEAAYRAMWVKWCGDTPAAGQTVELGRQPGLGGEQADVVAQRLMPAGQGGGLLLLQPGVVTITPPPGSQSSEEQASLQEQQAVLSRFREGKYAEVEAMGRVLTQRHPRHGFGWKVLAVAILEQRRVADALEPMQRAAALLPGDREVHRGLGVIFLHQERQAEAEACLRKALQIDPAYTDAYDLLGPVLAGQGRLAEAEASLRKALELGPPTARMYNNLGKILRLQEKYGEAEAMLRRALALKEDYPEAHNNLAIVLRRQGQLTEAEASLHRALALKPNDAEAQSNLGNALKDQGRLAEAAASFRRALEIKPDYAHAHSNLLFCLAHDARLDAAALFAEHRRFGERFEAPLRAAWPRHPNTREPQRRLRIGLVSADLRNHAVASFLEPVLAHWAQDSGLSLHAYSTHALEDAVTQRLRGHVAHWHAVAALSEAALAEQIQADGIDILLDLSGHTAGNRLLTFARKPAPVQASWIGYAGTTGLQAMDYYLADRHFLPPGQFDGQFTEKIVQLAAGLTFQPVADAPAVNALPALAKGYVTFGSFNRLEKLSREVIALWAQVLRAVPGSRLVLGALPEADGGEAVVAWLAQEGIGRERLSLHKRCGIHEYLALHHQVDICLDTFPYNGATTSLHALWMGVPTLSLAGRTPTGRQGATVLGHVGLDEFVAWEAQEFVAKAVHWAGEVAALAQLRAGLRERVAASALGRPAVVAACLARGLRTMWQRWCAGEAPQSFEVALNDTGRSIQEGNT
jgi:protein O-GlcNAc transferase